MHIRAGSLAMTQSAIVPKSWWFLLESLEDPVRELLRIYNSNPVWRRHFPDAFILSGWERFSSWIRDRYGFDTTWYDT
jgi:hypothetical protein